MGAVCDLWGFYSFEAVIVGDPESPTSPARAGRKNVQLVKTGTGKQFVVALKHSEYFCKALRDACCVCVCVFSAGRGGQASRLQLHLEQRLPWRVDLHVKERLRAHQVLVFGKFGEFLLSLLLLLLL